MMETKTTVLVENLKYPESPRWHRDALWCCDFFTGRVVRVDLHGNLESVVELPNMATAVGWTPQGTMLLVSASDRRLLARKDHELVTVADMAQLVRYPLNDMVVDGEGRVYIGSLGYDFGNPEATPQPAPLLLVSPDGDARIVADGLAFPNGMAITPDGRSLLVAESHAARLTAFTIEGDGSLVDRRVWAQFEDRSGITPDGISLDSTGAIWLASPNTREVLRVHEGGEITHRVGLATIPLACMLGGPERRMLFITTVGSFDPTAADAIGRIETLQVDVAGAGLP